MRFANKAKTGDARGRRRTLREDAGEEFMEPFGDPRIHPIILASRRHRHCEKDERREPSHPCIPDPGVLAWQRRRNLRLLVHRPDTI